MFDRMLRAAFLQPQAYREAERGGLGLTLEAMLVVIITGALAGVGAGFGDDNFGEGFAGGVTTEIVGWLLWAIVTFFVGTRVFSAQTTLGETARTIGFAYSPGVLLALAFIPAAGPIIALVVLIWRLLAVYIALNVALGINPLYTLLTVVISVLPTWALTFVVVFILDVGSG